jgi:hypothetical protein
MSELLNRSISGLPLLRYIRQYNREAKPIKWRYPDLHGESEILSLLLRQAPSEASPQTDESLEFGGMLGWRRLPAQPKNAKRLTEAIAELERGDETESEEFHGNHEC